MAIVSLLFRMAGGVCMFLFGMKIMGRWNTAKYRRSPEKNPEFYDR
ncbi:MAG: hypothetical protein FWH35_02920 [Treponema sp.]|nr:hypothetical protein [Treponema sp.]